MKIELVGGPLCGQIVDVKYLNGELDIWGAGRYRRRDKPFALSTPGLAVYGQKGHRMYDHVKGSIPADQGKQEA